jgi:hypothetical protein
MYYDPCRIAPPFSELQVLDNHPDEWAITTNCRKHLCFRHCRVALLLIIRNILRCFPSAPSSKAFQSQN